MQGMARIISAFLVVCLSLPFWAEGSRRRSANKVPSVKLPGPAFVALETINPEHIRWHVRFLSHDLLEGRGTGQRGGDLAAEYIATQFAEYGLKPAGDHGTLHAEGAAGRNHDSARNPLLACSQAGRGHESQAAGRVRRLRSDPAAGIQMSTPRSCLWDTALKLRNTTGTTTKASMFAAKFC